MVLVEIFLNKIFSILRNKTYNFNKLLNKNYNQQNLMVNGMLFERVITINTNDSVKSKSKIFLLTM